MFEKYTHCVFVIVSVVAMNFSSQYKTKKKKKKKLNVKNAQNVF